MQLCLDDVKMRTRASVDIVCSWLHKTSDHSDDTNTSLAEDSAQCRQPTFRPNVLRRTPRGSVCIANNSAFVNVHRNRHAERFPHYILHYAAGDCRPDDDDETRFVVLQFYRSHSVRSEFSFVPARELQERFFCCRHFSACRPCNGAFVSESALAG